MIKVLITVKGGVVDFVYSTEPIEFVVVDFDNIEHGDEVPTMEEVITSDKVLTEQEMDEYLTTIRIDKMLKQEETTLVTIIKDERISLRDATIYLNQKDEL